MQDDSSQKQTNNKMAINEGAKEDLVRRSAVFNYRFTCNRTHTLIQ